MTPAFYRARLWLNRSRISAKVGGRCGTPFGASNMVNRTSILSFQTLNYMQYSVFNSLTYTEYLGGGNGLDLIEGGATACASQ
jgi:hypothetical protein